MCSPFVEKRADLPRGVFPQYRTAPPEIACRGVTASVSTARRACGLGWALYGGFFPRGTRFDIRITAEGRDDEPMGREQSKGIPGPACALRSAPSSSVPSSRAKASISLVDVLGPGRVVSKVQESDKKSQNPKRQNSDEQFLRIVAQSKGIEGKKPSDVVDALTGAITEGPKQSKGHEQLCLGRQ